MTLGQRVSNIAGDHAERRAGHRRGAVHVRADARRRERIDALREQRTRRSPTSTSPVPAVARRASPPSTTNAAPCSSATTVVGPFNKTTAPVCRASARAASMRSAPGACPIERAVLTVVGREHGGPAAAARRSSPTRSPSATSASPSTTSATSSVATQRQTASANDGRATEAGPDDHRLHAADLVGIDGEIDAQRHLHRFDRRQPDRMFVAGNRDAHIARTGTRRAHRRELRRARHARRAADHPRRSAPFVRCRDRAAAARRATSLASTRCASRARYVEADVGDHDLAAQRRARVGTTGPASTRRT